MRPIAILMIFCLFGCDRTSTPTAIDPNPDFRETVATVTRLEIVNRTFDPDSSDLVDTSYRIDDAATVTEFLEIFVLEPYSEGSFTHCMCSGDPIVRVFSGSDKLTEFTLHHCTSIRWPDGAETDIGIAASSRGEIEAFLSDRGIKCE